jgi:hypothetical protein
MDIHRPQKIIHGPILHSLSIMPLDYFDLGHFFNIFVTLVPLGEIY